MLRVLVVDRSAATRDVVAELLGDLAIDVAWAPRDGATAALRGAIADGKPFDCIVLDGEPAPTSQLVRELVTQGGGVRVIVSAAGPDAASIASRCGATDWVPRPFTAAEVAFRVGRSAALVERADKRRPRKSDVLIGTGPWIRSLRPHRDGRGDRCHRRDLRASGTGKELVARTIQLVTAARRAVRRRQLRGDSGDAHRERAVRPRARRVHGCDARSRRLAAGRAHRDAVP
jgi:DNA-binding NtrC family response regulator